MSESSPAITLKCGAEQRIEGQLLDYPLRDGVLADVYSMARLKRREC